MKARPYAILMINFRGNYSKKAFTMKILISRDANLKSV